MKHVKYNRQTQEFTYTEIGDVKPIGWLSVTDRQQVYLTCYDNGEEMVCGPFIVKSAADRTLTNVRNKTFMHYGEALMVKQ